MKKALKKLDNKGFTLVELIIVIAIIAVLAAVLAPQYIKYVDKARWSTDQNNASTLLHEVEVAIVDAGASGDTITGGGKIVINADNTTPTTVDSDITDSLTEADSNWRTIKVQNKHSEQPTNSSTYTITIAADGKGASGAWS